MRGTSFSVNGHRARARERKKERETFIVNEDKESEIKSRAHTKGCYRYDTGIEFLHPERERRKVGISKNELSERRVSPLRNVD